MADVNQTQEEGKSKQGTRRNHNERSNKRPRTTPENTRNGTLLTTKLKVNKRHAETECTQTETELKSAKKPDTGTTSPNTAS